MARADLLLDLVRAGARGDRPLFRKSLEALVTEERAKQHHVLADRLAAHLNAGDLPNAGASPSPAHGRPGQALTRRNGPVAGSFHELYPERRLGDLVLPASVASAGRELVEEFRRADLLRAHNLEPRHRVLLTGPPGNGKTSLAEAFATELAVPLFAVRYESVIASYLGETAVRLSRLFDEVRTRRCVLFFDEFDVVGKERGDVHETGEIKRVVSSLLLQIDDLPSHVVVITATNHPELLDRAVWRRFSASAESSGAHPLVGGGVVLSFRETPWREPGIQARHPGEASQGPQLLRAGAVRSRRTAAIRAHAPRPRCTRDRHRAVETQWQDRSPTPASPPEPVRAPSDA